MDFSYLLSDDKVHRIVTVSSPCISKVAVSYGLIVFCAKTKRTVLVRRKHSVAYLMILNGFYRESYLWEYIPCLSKEESEIIRKCLNSKRYFDFCQNKVGCLIKSEYAKTKFYKNKELIEIIYSKFKSSHKDLQWYWPKGKLTNNAENHYECAKREFIEEVESLLPDPIYISPNWIGTFFLVKGSKRIENNFILYIVEEEFQIGRKLIHNSEVSDRAWFDLEACKNIIFDDSFFDTVISFIPSEYL